MAKTTLDILMYEGATGIARHYAETFDVDSVTLAVMVAETLGTPTVLCTDCQQYVPALALTQPEIKCPASDRGYGHRASSIGLQSHLDVAENRYRDLYPVRVEAGVGE